LISCKNATHVARSARQSIKIYARSCTRKNDARRILSSPRGRG
jgi:hypothetical protein